jgi:hypothetical protein
VVLGGNAAPVLERYLQTRYPAPFLRNSAVI